VPRGILRHVVIKILNREPLSGIDLMDEIERYTSWRPSPGSIYPLLAHLKEDGLIEPYPNEDPSIKSFNLTQKGKSIFEAHKKHDKQLSKGYKSIRKIYWRLHREMPQETYNIYAELIDLVEETYSMSKDNPKKSKHLKKILQETSEKLRKMAE
jgi:DNA-binding PadR family transcriptional regulator